MRARSARPSACASAACRLKKGWLWQRRPTEQDNKHGCDTGVLVFQRAEAQHRTPLYCIAGRGWCQQMRCHRMAAADAGIGHLCLASRLLGNPRCGHLHADTQKLKRKAKIYNLKPTRQRKSKPVDRATHPSRRRPLALPVQGCSARSRRVELRVELCLNCKCTHASSCVICSKQIKNKNSHWIFADPRHFVTP